MDLLELFDKGGPLMWVILAASVVGLFFFFDRLWALRRRQILPMDTFRALDKHLKAGDADRAASMCRENESVLCRVVDAGLSRRAQGRASAKEAMEEAGQVQVGALGRGTGVLATVAAIAPLLGLLGTVTGMIQVFRDVAGADNPDIAVLAVGIWQALITTGAGLTVAIPFYVAYRFVDSRIEQYALELEEASLALLDAMVELPSDDGGGAAQRPEASDDDAPEAEASEAAA